MFKLFFVILVYFLTFSGTLYADFFSTCGINQRAVQNINYVMQNSSGKFIPREINDVDNKTFRQALYLLSFYQIGETLPEELLDVVGLKVIKQVPRFRQYAINYFLKKNVNVGDDIFTIFDKQEIYNEALFVLKNKYFQPNEDNVEVAKKILKQVFRERLLKYDDIVFLKKKFDLLVPDEFLSQQIRFYLWEDKTTDLHKVAKLIKDQKIIQQIDKMEEFYHTFNKKVETIVKLKNGKIKKSYVDLTKRQKQQLCSKWMGQDEFIDLTCLAYDKQNIDIMYKLLISNLNPIFLPQKWLTYRLYFVRDVINKQKDLDDDIYEIIANGGRLYGDSAFTQQFLAGFVAYLRHDYANAILHFTTCVKISKFAEYNAKANYWLAMSYRETNDMNASQDAFRNAAKHTFTMYGQLAAVEIGEKPETNIENYILSFQEHPEILCNDVNFVIGYLHQYKENKVGLSPILSAYVKDTYEREKIFNALMVIQQDFHKQTANALGIYALRYDVAYNDASFPMTEYENDSLINAVIKKESNFKPKTIGSCGERGLMQIMPSTGRFLAKNMRIKYNHNKLLIDDEYNVNMGKFYLEKLLQYFDNHKLLALAAYNAGRGNVEKWMERNGDPRHMGTNKELVEWIEKIPFAFTRGYVAYILGFEMVYDVIKKINEDRANVQNLKRSL